MTQNSSKNQNLYPHQSRITYHPMPWDTLYLVSANSFYDLLNIHIITTFWKLSNYIHAMYLLFMIPCIFWGGNLAIQYINVIWSHFSLTLQIVTGDFWTQWKNVLGIINISNTVTPLLDDLHYEKKLTKNIRPTKYTLVFSKCSQIY